MYVGGAEEFDKLTQEEQEEAEDKALAFLDGRKVELRMLKVRIRVELGLMFMLIALL